MTDAESALSLPVRQYRWLDRLSKLGGLALVAVGLEVGGSSVEGLTLAAVGAALAVATVFVRQHNEP
jgi:uncharacterized membrane protein